MTRVRSPRRERKLVTRLIYNQTFSKTRRKKRDFDRSVFFAKVASELHLPNPRVPFPFAVAVARQQRPQPPLLGFVATFACVLPEPPCDRLRPAHRRLDHRHLDRLLNHHLDHQLKCVGVKDDDDDDDDDDDALPPVPALASGIRFLRRTRTRRDGRSLWPSCTCDNPS